MFARFEIEGINPDFCGILGKIGARGIELPSARSVAAEREGHRSSFLKAERKRYAAAFKPEIPRVGFVSVVLFILPVGVGRGPAYGICERVTVFG